MTEQPSEWVYQWTGLVDQDESVEIPDSAIGHTVDTFSDSYSVRYLVPAEEVDS
jgi:hypothetical protein